MSYDVYMNHTIGARTYRIIEVDNMTSNIRPMLDLALGVEDWEFIHGKLGKDIVIILQKGVSSMESEPDKFEALNPKNGWGSYGTCLMFLRNILKACKENPDLTLEISA